MSQLGQQSAVAWWWVCAIACTTLWVTTNANESTSPYVVCLNYLKQAKQAIVASGPNLLEEIVHDQYLSNPEGPYVFCFENVPSSTEDSVGSMVMSVHPYLPNATLREIVVDVESGMVADYFELKKRTLLDNLDSKGEFYNFTEPVDQPQSREMNGIVVGNKLQNIVGFVQKSDEEYIHCGCQYTGVPDGPRDNRNAVQGASGGGHMSTLSLSTGLLVTIYILIWNCPYTRIYV